MHSPKPEVAAVLDASGSMAGEPIDLGMAHVVDIARATGCPLKVYIVDTYIRSVGKVYKHEDLRGDWVAGGGTDLRCGIDAAMKSAASVIVVITDCATPWPSKEQIKRGKKLIIGSVCRPGENYVPDYLQKSIVKCYDE
jgi:predicted metal-dependent peptidase